MENERKRRKRALSAKRMIVPMAAAILIMHVLIVFNTLHIKNLSELIAEATQNNFAVSGISNSLSKSTDGLSEAAMGYVNGGESGMLADYLTAFGEMQGSYSALQQMLLAAPVEGAPKLRAEAAEESAAQRLDAVGEAVKERGGIEQTAMVLAAQAREEGLSAYPMLAAVELPAELSALPAEAKLGQAQGMLRDSAYQSKRGDIQRNLSIAVGMANSESAAKIQRLSARLAASQMRQWVLMGLIITVIAVMIVLLFVWLLIPLEKSVALVQQGVPLPTGRGFSELRRLAGSYDELLAHRNQLEEDLRRQSHTDALTGLPNRLAYEDRIAELDAAPADTSLIMFSMDVNGLKETNDSKGHRFGDKLLREAADCIRSVFGGETGKNVFRFGGDEFAAIWQGRSEQEVLDALERFRADQERRGISISVGYARLADNPGLTAQHLFDRADQSMYKAKTAFKHDADETCC